MSNYSITVTFESPSHRNIFIAKNNLLVKGIKCENTLQKQKHIYTSIQITDIERRFLLTENKQ
jgi:hypothetical protein